VVHAPWGAIVATNVSPASSTLGEVVAEISRIKDEPEWMTKMRLKAYRHFESRPLPTWGGDMTGIDFQDIYYYVTGTGKSVQSWDDVPDYIRRTYDRLLQRFRGRDDLLAPRSAS